MASGLAEHHVSSYCRSFDWWEVIGACLWTGGSAHLPLGCFLLLGSQCRLERRTRLAVLRRYHGSNTDSAVELGPTVDIQFNIVLKNKIIGDIYLE